MRRAILTAGLAISCACAFAQTSEVLPSFEVASIKPAAPMTGGRIMIGIRGGPGTPDPGQMTFSNVSLKNLIQSAYDVKGFQIQGPDWLDSLRFDIQAKVPPGTTKEQARLMQQNLLAERFKLSLHHSSKEMPVYALVVAKGGLKMKEAADEPPATDAGGPNDGGGRGRGEGFGGKPMIGKDGMPQMPAGAPRGASMMMMVNGRMRMQANGSSMPRLVDMLANQLDRPVLDQTDLKGKYDITLDFAQDENTQRIMQMKMAAAGGPIGGPPGGGGEGAGTPDGQSGPSLFSAVQEQLGLKLEARKGPVDLLVIDSVEKAPTEN